MFNIWASFSVNSAIQKIMSSIPCLELLVIQEITLCVCIAFFRFIFHFPMLPVAIL